MSDDEPYAVLGVKRDADGEALRAAYLSKIREHPPERDPEMFERIRDAYRMATDPKLKMRRIFDASWIRRPLGDLIANSGDAPEGRAFLGPAPWLELLRHEAGERRDKGKGRS